jgi:hypothetical protein
LTIALPIAQAPAKYVLTINYARVDEVIEEVGHAANGLSRHR